MMRICTYWACSKVLFHLMKPKYSIISYLVPWTQLIDNKGSDQTAWIAQTDLGHLFACFNFSTLWTNSEDDKFFPENKDLTSIQNCLLKRQLALNVELWKILWPVMQVVSLGGQLQWMSNSEKGFDLLCKLSVNKTSCMKCQTLFSGKNKTNISECCLNFFLVC